MHLEKFVDYITTMPWDKIAIYAPIVTASTAIFAVIAALISIFVQRSVARKRAAIDFFLKTEMDQTLLDAYDKFNSTILALNSAKSMEEFSLTDDFRSIRRYLYIHELMSVGILKGVFDERVCHSYWSDVLTQAYRDTKRAIDFLQSKPDGKYTFIELQALNKKWSNPKRSIFRCGSGP